MRLAIFFLLSIAPLFGEKSLEPLFHSTLDFYGKLLRTENGMYRDAYELDGEQSKRCSTAAVGVGLIALCMDHELGRDPQANKKALQTLRAINGKVADFQIDREPTGYFRHFFQSDTGKGTSEFSTIDTAIMMIGAQFCGNHFDDLQIKTEVEELWKSINWSLALAAPEGSKLHMVIENGKPKPRTVTILFNEYYLLAKLISQEQTLSINELPTLNEGGLILLSEPRHTRQSSFTIQFPFYLSPDPAFTKFARAQALADYRASQKWSGEKHLWGSGAGMMPGGGYQANVFSRNPEQVISPHIIAGFIPVFPEAKNHLLKLYQDSKRGVASPVGKLLPRFSLKHLNWRAPRIEAIDYSSMLHGLAADHPKLGMEFFKRGVRKK